MSYVIHLWTDAYKPGSLADAQAQLELPRRLGRRVPEPHFHALMERISAAYGEAVDSRLRPAAAVTSGQFKRASQ